MCKAPLPAERETVAPASLRRQRDESSAALAYVVGTKAVQFPKYQISQLLNSSDRMPIIRRVPTGSVKLQLPLDIVQQPARAKPE